MSLFSTNMAISETNSLSEISSLMFYFISHYFFLLIVSRIRLSWLHQLLNAPHRNTAQDTNNTVNKLPLPLFFPSHTWNSTKFHVFWLDGLLLLLVKISVATTASAYS